MIVLARFLLNFLVLGSLLLGPAIATAQTTEQAWSVRHNQIEQLLTSLKNRLDVEQPGPNYYARLKDDLQSIAEELQALRTTALEQVREAKVLLDAIGPPPEEGETPETEAITEERNRLQQSVAKVAGRVGLVDVLIARAQQIRDRISETEAQSRAEGLLARDTSLLQPGVWIRALGQIPGVVANLTEAVSGRALEVGLAMPAEGASAIMLAALLGAVIVGWPLRRILLRSFGQDASIEAPSYARRLLSAVAEAIARGIMPALAALFVFVAVRSLDVLPERELGILRVGLAVGAVLYISLAALRATLAAGMPQWRLLWMDDACAVAFSRRATAFGSAVGLSYFLLYAGNALSLPDEIEKVIQIALRVVVALTLLLLLDRRFWPDAPPATDDDAEHAPDTTRTETKRSSPWWRLIRIIVIFLIVVNPLLVGAGFSALANWIFYSLITSGGMIAGLWIVHRLVHDIVALLFSTDRSAIASMRATIISTETAATRTRFWLLMMVDAVLVLLGVPAILLAWGMDPVQLMELVDAALFGFSVGDMEISIATFVYAILIFILFVVGTRVIQRFLERQILPHTGLDSGAQNSIKTGFGYIGLIVAALAATSAIGINLQNLALIAGALSVGIGFGLQNVVNNFVSGLILLVERPIKVGDWVVVGNHEGIVKRISVRATEVVTFQQASVIIPNSELISGVVQNWTLQDASARIDVPVGVAYGSDVNQVSDLLLECVRNHPKARRYPEPTVIFSGFGDSSLDFIARVHISNALDRIVVLSDLNHAINASFVEHGIEIPFPQRDLHLRTTGDLAEALRKNPAPGDAT